MNRPITPTPRSSAIQRYTSSINSYLNSCPLISPSNHKVKLKKKMNLTSPLLRSFHFRVTSNAIISQHRDSSSTAAVLAPILVLSLRATYPTLVSHEIMLFNVVDAIANFRMDGWSWRVSKSWRGFDQVQARRTVCYFPGLAASRCTSRQT